MAETKYDNSASIAKQIENTADYFPPATYSGTGYAYGIPASYLTYYNELVLTPDTLSEQYVPLSAVPSKGRNPKLFAVGVIPPSSNISGRLLSRESTVRTLVPYVPTTGQTTKDRSQFVKELVEEACGGKQGRNENDPVYQQVTEGRDVGAAQKSYSSCGDLAHWMLYRMGVRSDYVNRNENGGWKAAQNISNLAFKCPAAEVPSLNTQYKPGDIALIWNNSDGTDAHAMVVVEQKGNQLVVGEYGQPGGAIHTRTIKTQEGAAFVGKRQIQRVIPLDKALAIARDRGELVDIELPNSGTPYPESLPSWNGDASEAAYDAQRFIEKLANTPLSTKDVGAQFTAAQTAQIKVIRDTVEAMANTPPLRLMVNPQSFSVKGEKIVSDSGWSRNGATIIEHWGNGQEKISASGKVAGFYAASILDGTGPGITRMARNASQSWQNFQSLQLFYANNGGVHTTDATSSTLERNLTMVGSIYIYYDSILYIGAFDSFSISESDTTPHTADYSFEFTVRAAFLLDNPDPNGGQGASGVAQQRASGSMVQR
jgi:hypothetical protein